MQQKWSVEQDGSVAVLTFAGFGAICDSCEACLTRWAAELKEECLPMTAERVVLDFTRATFTSVVFLRCIVYIQRYLRDRGAECRVCVSADSREVFAITKLGQIIRLFDDRDSALAADARPQEPRHDA